MALPIQGEVKGRRFRYFGIVFEDPEWQPPMEAVCPLRVVVGQLEEKTNKHWQMYEQFTKPVSVKQCAVSVGLPRHKKGEKDVKALKIEPAPWT